MSLLKRIYLVVLIIILLSLSAFSCSYNNQNINVKELIDNNYLGEFSVNDLLFKSHLNSIELIFDINVSGSNCYNKSDFKLKFSQTGLPIEPHSFSVDKYSSLGFEVYHVDFLVNNLGSITFSDAPQSSLIINGTSIPLTYIFDDTSPSLDLSIGNFNSNYIYPPGNFTITLSASDLGSGLKEVSLGNFYDNSSLNGSQSFSKTFKEYINSNTLITAIATDRLGNSASKKLQIHIDNDVPSFVNLKVIADEQEILNRKVNVVAQFEDSSFNYSNYNKGKFFVKANFKNIDGINQFVDGSCYKTGGDKITCQWLNVNNLLKKPSSVVIIFNISDFVGHSRLISERTGIVMGDREPPKIESFYLLNDIGNKNLISAVDNNGSYLYIKVSDFSQVTIANFQANFDISGLNTLTLDSNLSNTKEGLFVYKLPGDFFQSLKNVNKTNVTLEVFVKDIFNQMSSKNLTIYVDNVPPVINSSKYIFVNQQERIVKGNLLFSGAEIQYQILTTGDVDSKNMHGDFSSVAMDYTKAKDLHFNCEVYNRDNNLVECDTPSFKLINGYVDKNVTIWVYDMAGNYVKLVKTFKIYKLSNETRTDFYVKNPIKIYSPLPRDVFYRKSNIQFPGWFVGHILKRNPKSNITIINYVIKKDSCNDSAMAPLKLNEVSLYPNIDLGNGSKFVIRTFISSDQTLSSLNRLNTKGKPRVVRCILSVRKRDNKNIYPTENVPIVLEYDFYNLPGGIIPEKEISNLESAVKSAETLGGIFNTLYKINKVYTSVCDLYHSANGILLTVTTTVGELVSIFSPEAGRPYFCTGTSFNSLRVVQSFMNKFCVFATCSWSKKFGPVGDLISKMDQEANSIIGCKPAGITNSNGKSTSSGSNSGNVKQTTSKK